MRRLKLEWKLTVRKLRKIKGEFAEINWSAMIQEYRGNIERMIKSRFA